MNLIIIICKLLRVHRFILSYFYYSYFVLKYGFCETYKGSIYNEFTKNILPNFFKIRTKFNLVKCSKGSIYNKLIKKYITKKIIKKF